MDPMTFLLAVSAVAALVMGVRRYATPSCPRCHRREWDRKLCAPLLFCRRCATRVDAQGRTYN